MRFRSIWSLLLLVLLGACGGGGGGSSTGGAFQIQFDQASVHLAAKVTDARPPAAVAVVGRAVNPPSTSVYLVVTYSQTCLENVQIQMSSQTLGVIMMTPKAPAVLGAGTFHETVAVHAYTDPSLTREYAGSPWSIPVTYAVANELQASSSTGFDYVQGAPAPTARDIQITGAGIGWQAGADKPWIRLGATTGTAPATLSVGVDPQGLAPGAYSGRVTLNPTDHSDPWTFEVLLSVSAPRLDPGLTTLSFSGINGVPFAVRTLNLGHTNGVPIQWTASSNAPWLVLGKTTGTTPEALTVSVDPSVGPLASGTYPAAIVFSATSPFGAETTTVPVDLTLTPATLTVSAPLGYAIGAPFGRTNFDRSSRFQFNLDPGCPEYPWTATLGAAWIKADVTSGVVGASGAAMNLTWLPASAAAGDFSGSIRIDVHVNGDLITTTVPANQSKDLRLVLADDPGVAFTHTPGMSALTRTLHLKDTFHLATAWTAASDQPWLTATASGTTPGDLVLTADPTGLAVDAMYYATVTVTSPEPTVAAPESIRVGFWVGSATPTGPLVLPSSYRELILDPIRPYAYVHNGGSDLTVYHLYTGAVVQTIAGLGTTLGSMTIASDGSSLYLLDTATLKVVPVSLPSFTPGTPWATALAASSRVHYVRNQGRGLLFLRTGEVLDAQDGRHLFTAYLGTNDADVIFASSLDGSHLGWMSQLAVTNNTLPTFTVGGLEFMSYPSPMVSFSSWNSSTGSYMTFVGDMALNADGSRILTSFQGSEYQGSYGFQVWDGTATQSQLPILTLLLPSNYGPNNVEVAKDGRYFLGSSVSGDFPDAWVTNAAGTPGSTFQLGSTGHPMLNGGMKVSSDGLLLVALTSEPALKILPVAPAPAPGLVGAPLP